MFEKMFYFHGIKQYVRDAKICSRVFEKMFPEFKTYSFVEMKRKGKMCSRQALEKERDTSSGSSLHARTWKIHSTYIGLARACGGCRDS